jgi:hypothetical protein
MVQTRGQEAAAKKAQAQPGGPQGPPPPPPPPPPLQGAPAQRKRPGKTSEEEEALPENLQQPDYYLDPDSDGEADKGLQGVCENLSMHIDNVKYSRKLLEETYWKRAREARRDINQRLQEQWQIEDTVLALEREYQRLTDEATAPASDLEALQKRIKESQTWLNDYKGKNPDLDPERRWTMHKKRREAEAKYEDFLYYQGQNQRSVHYRNVEVLRQKLEKARQKRAHPNAHKHPTLWQESAYEEAWEIKLIQRYGKARFDNILAPSDKESPEAVRDAGPQTHDQLRTWTPIWKYRPVGLGQGFEKRPPTHHSLPALDDEDIERRRAMIEDNRGFVETGGPESRRFQNHSERRLQDIEDEKRGVALESSRIRDAIGEKRDIKLEARRGHGKMEVHISALEKSDDWPTSYDLSGIVKRGYSSVVANAVARSKLNPEDGSDEQREQETNKYKDFFTGWAEDTYGRREFHVHNRYIPASPVESPPHSPIIKNHQSSPQDNINVPVDVPHGAQNRTALRSKRGDHYGVKNDQWPWFSNLATGGGFLVPYDRKLERGELPQPKRRR